MTTKWGEETKTIRRAAARKASQVLVTALLVATVWCLIAAEVLTIAWNVALVPLCRVPPISFGQGLALVLLLELLARIFRPGQQKGA